MFAFVLTLDWVCLICCDACCCGFGLMLFGFGCVDLLAISTGCVGFIFWFVWVVIAELVLILL